MHKHTNKYTYKYINIHILTLTHINTYINIHTNT